MFKVGIVLVLVPVAIFVIWAVYLFIRNVIKECKTTEERIYVTIISVLLLSIFVGMGLLIAGGGV